MNHNVIFNSEQGKFFEEEKLKDDTIPQPTENEQY